MLTAVSAPASLLGGRLADRFGRKNVFLVIRTLGALFRVPYGFLGNTRAEPWLLFTSWGGWDRYGIAVIWPVRFFLGACGADLFCPGRLGRPERRQAPAD